MTYMFLILLAILAIASLFFSASETAYVAINKHELQQSGKPSLSSKLALKLLSRPEKMLSLILLGNNFANVSFAAFVSALTIRYGNENLLFLTSALTTLFILIFCEVFPKTIAFYYPRQIVLISSLLLFALQKLLSPFVFFVGGFSVFLRKFFFPPQKEKNYAAARSLGVIRGAVLESKGFLSDSHRKMLLNVLELGGFRIEEVMKPLALLESVNLAEKMEKIKKQLGESSNRDLLFYRHNFKNCLGLLRDRQRNRLLADAHLTKRKILSLIEKPVYIPGSVNLLKQLDFFIAENADQVLVVDEYGDLQGAVSLHDIMASIAGKITFLMQESPSGAFVVSGNTPLREISKNLGINLDVSKATTLQGLVYERLESLPSGAVCILEEGFRMEITELEKGRIISARIWRQ